MINIHFFVYHYTTRVLQPLDAGVFSSFRHDVGLIRTEGHVLTAHYPSQNLQFQVQWKKTLLRN